MKQENDPSFGKENKETEFKFSKGVNCETRRTRRIETVKSMRKLGGRVRADSGPRPAGPGHGTSGSELGARGAGHPVLLLVWASILPQ